MAVKSSLSLAQGRPALKSASPSNGSNDQVSRADHQWSDEDHRLISRINRREECGKFESYLVFKAASDLSNSLLPNSITAWPTMGMELYCNFPFCNCGEPTRAEASSSFQAVVSSPFMAA